MVDEAPASSVLPLPAGLGQAATVIDRLAQFDQHDGACSLTP